MYEWKVRSFVLRLTLNCTFASLKSKRGWNERSNCTVFFLKLRSLWVYNSIFFSLIQKLSLYTAFPTPCAFELFLFAKKETGTWEKRKRWFPSLLFGRSTKWKQNLYLLTRACAEGTHYLFVWFYLRHHLRHSFKDLYFLIAFPLFFRQA